MQHPHGGAPPPPPPPAPQGGVYAEQPPQQAAPRQDGIPYIGSRISLISKTDIRYEGFLFNIDTRQSMVALQHVRSFGTEGRRAEHIPPSDQVLPYATFKASEIKDLHVCEAAPPPTYPGAGVYAQPPPPPMPQQPYQHYQQQPPQAQAQPQAPQAPQASQAPRAPVPPLQSPVKKTQSPVKAKPTAGPTLLTPGSFQTKPEAPKRQEYTQPPPQQQQYQQQQYQQQYQQQPQQQYQQPPHRQQQQQQQYQAPPANDASSHSHNNRAAQSNASRTIPGMGDHLLKRKERRVPGGAEGGLASVSSGSDFNFEQGLGGFDKEEEFSKLSVDDNKAKGSYQKSSFFDTISCDALDRLEGKQGRVTMSQERKLNTETFGAVGLNNNRRGFRGGRGGGGGGRGGGRRSNYNGGGSRNGGGGGRGGNNNRGDQWSTRGVGGRDPTSA